MGNSKGGVGLISGKSVFPYNGNSSGGVGLISGKIIFPRSGNSSGGVGSISAGLFLVQRTTPEKKNIKNKLRNNIKSIFYK